MTERNNCILDNKSSVKKLYTLERFPVFMGCVDTPVEDDIFFDQDWGVSENGLVQLKTLIDPNTLYENSHTPGSVGKIWQQHHKRFFNFIVENSDDIDRYLEIGGASGSLWKNFSTLDSQFSYEIIEPSHQKSSDSRLKYIRGFYETQSFDEKYKCIIHSHVFEHAYNPIDFLKKIFEDLTDDGVQFISIPNMRHWLKQGYTNTINFEHTYYLDEFVLEHVLARAGFSIDKKVVDTHSVFVKAVKSSDIGRVNVNFEYSKDLFLDYIYKLKSDVSSILDNVEDNVYLFGAHIFSQTLLNFGIDENIIISVLDNDVKKQGRRLYGTNLKIESPEVLRDVDKPTVILRAGVYTEEIKDQILNINSTTRFI